MALPLPDAPFARMAELMAAFQPDWFVCGGWAIDTWLGRQTRDHGDFDISVFHEDQRAIFEHLAGWSLIAHDANVDQETKEPWDGRWLDLPAHIHAVAEDGFVLEVLLNEHRGDGWVLSEEPLITVADGRYGRESPVGLPTVVPEVLLFYKATAYFPKHAKKDEVDFFAFAPHLGEGPRQWLREAIALVRPGHPWLVALGD